MGGVTLPLICTVNSSTENLALYNKIAHKLEHNLIINYERYLKENRRFVDQNLLSFRESQMMLFVYGITSLSRMFNKSKINKR